MKLHEDITFDRLVDACQESVFGTGNPGFCNACGAEHDACEPDARNYKCYECGAMEVYGAEWLMITAA